MVAGKENKIQSAIAGALEVYCQCRNLQLFAPYANQQGDQLRKYCGDLLGLVDGADLIALEVKEFDVGRRILPAFDAEQHENAKQFEALGVPLAYAYNAIETLPYHSRPKPSNWARLTLASVKRSKPTSLPGQAPHVCRHESLLEWLEGEHGMDAADLFGRVNGALHAVDDLRNGVMVLLYAVSQQTLAALAPEDIIRTIKILSENSDLKQRHGELLRRILESEADVFNRFNSP